MKLFLEIILLCYFAGLANSNQNFQYEKKHMFGLGKRIPNFHFLNRKAYEYPQPLPTSTSKEPSVLIHQPYPSLYQGTKGDDDVKVFNRAFSFPPTPVGHRVVCEDLLDCNITFMSIETDKSIPIILRGGAGYRHFTVVVRAKPFEALEGIIRAYCRRAKEDTL